MHSRMVCAGCDTARPADELLSFSCPNRGQGEADHVLRVELSPETIVAGWPQDTLSSDENAFVRYRKLSHSWHLATARGITDAEYVAMAEELGERLSEVEGKPLGITPALRSEELATAIKNETANISGSHKARHLIGTALHLEIADRLGAKTRDSVLAIASCGNAALAAAVVAKAAGRRLRVFIPPNAAEAVVAKLEALGAEQVVCERLESDPAGDPCYLRFVEAVTGGALPLSCQGGDNALALIGGQSLGWEMVEQYREDLPTDIFVQVGGGALASSLIQAFSMAHRAGIIDALPRFHAVQTANAHPLVRAWKLLRASGESVAEARAKRASFMWPWESEPVSIAGGILDDETYDWLSILTGLVESHGSALVVSEERLREAQAIAQSTTRIQVDATGTSGFAGLLQARSSGSLPKDARPLVLFTGAIR
ncbi:MAG: pyridoxal-phosphate dependent enzyme [Myxococcales bacterium]|nr:pyridoxal-phosphate dependent enzyme [Myxococcales bacterium]